MTLIRPKISVIIGFMVTVFLLFLAACGGNSKKSRPDALSKPVSISILPETALVEAGARVTLNVTAQNTDFTVSVNPTYGNCVKSGYSAVCTPVATGTYDVIVIATADNTKTATARITVMVLADFNHWFYGINNDGLIAGSYYDNSADIVKAFVKDGGVYTIIDNPDSTGDTLIFGINDSGHILGSFDNGYFLKTDAGYIDLEDYEDSEGSYLTHYTGINNSGLLVGYFEDSTGYTRGFIKNGSVFTVIEHPSAVHVCSAYLYCGTWLSGINNSGSVAGAYGSSDGVYRGFVYDGEYYFTVDHPDSRAGNLINIYIGGINDSGLSAGYFWGSDGYSTGFTALSDGGDFTPIEHPGTAGNGGGAHVLGVNNSGRIVGWFDAGGKARGFLID